MNRKRAMMIAVWSGFLLLVAIFLAILFRIVSQGDWSTLIMLAVAVAVSYFALRSGKNRRR